MTGTRATGSFFCPTCGSEQDYRHQRTRRFFTLYFLPVLPIGTLGEYVECTHCMNTFKPEVLDYDPASEQAAFASVFETAIRKVMAKMMVADGEVDDAEVAAIAQIFERLAGEPLSAEQVREDAVVAAGDDTPLTEVVESLLGTLNERGKELVVRAAVLVAMADGEFAEEEQALVADIGAALELPAEQVEAVIAAALADGAPAADEGGEG